MAWYKIRTDELNPTEVVVEGDMLDYTQYGHITVRRAEKLVFVCGRAVYAKEMV